MQQKIGLFALTSIVIGSQVGSGVFMLPQLLAPFGAFAIAGWVLSGLGALCLAMVFVGLVKRYPKTGGPHAYVQQAFGDTAAFFTGWTYWVVSSLSSATVIAATITYLTPIIGIQSPLTFVSYELFLLFMITCLNLRGVGSASFVEILLGAIKLITLFAIPVAGLMLFNVEHISIAPIMVVNLLTPVASAEPHQSRKFRRYILTIQPLSFYSGPAYNITKHEPWDHDPCQGQIHPEQPSRRGT